jgi:hypothetical protein
MPHPREKNCFLRIKDYDYEHWLKKRHKKDPVVEVAVDYGVPNIASMVMRVEILKTGGRSRVIFEK